MLSSLSIREFAIVERLDLELREGFTVLTGETGAGKSILIDALQFVLGERADADLIREGARRAEVSAEFHCGAQVQDWLARSELDGPEVRDGAPASVLVRRTLEPGGRSRAFINGSPATLGQVRELGELLLDVHGQHAHQSLLRPSAQQRLLDDVGGLQDEAHAVAEAFATWRAAARACTKAATDFARTEQEIAQLEHRIEDLGALVPEAGEWEREEAEQRRLAHGAALLDGARTALDAIGESEESAQARVARVAARLGTLREFDPAIAPAVDALAAAQIQLDEAVHALNQYLARSEFDDARLAQVEERIAALHAAGRRWRCAPSELPALLESSRAQLEHLSFTLDLDKLRAAEAQAKARYEAAAAVLSQARRVAAAHMGKEVTRAMQDLAMEGGSLVVALEAAEASASGLEKVEFLVSGYEGGAPRPLARVASGGELSRISLAIAVIAASANPVPTLIFDEVDAGIGGQVAATVGALLRQLGQSRQVLCVTHLPQVAACGEHHLAVAKSLTAEGRPTSQAQALGVDARVQEIARMLGGAEITTITKRHAKEMLSGAGA
jgi:DNA repair protein RecN (Recombination protein N)